MSEPTLITPTETPVEDVNQASPFYCTGEEAIRISSFGSVAGVELALRTRFLRKDGWLIPTNDRHVPSANRTIVTSETPLSDGWLIGCELHAVVGSPRRGQVFVVVDLIRGVGAGATVLQTLAQGYVTDTSRLSYPSSPIDASVSGNGVLRSITGTNPAANTEVSETVPTNARWRLVGVDLTLVADANVANRDIALVFDDGANIFTRVAVVQAVTAGQTAILSFGRNVQRGVGSVNIVLNAPLPDLQLQGGFRFRTVTSNRQVGDDYSAPQYLVEEWIED